MRGESLTQLEEAAVKVFEKSDGCSFVAENTPDLADELLRNSQKNSMYEDLSWIWPTSNKLEGFLNEAKYFSGSYRNSFAQKNSSPIFFHMNKCFWSVETIQKVLNAGEVKWLMLSLIHSKCF